MLPGSIGALRNEADPLDLPLHSPALCVMCALDCGLRNLSTIPRQMKNLKQHPLKNIVERLSSDEIESLLFCEGLVDLTNPEIKSVCESDWFKSLPSFQRALFVCAAVDWYAPGTNQYKSKISEKSSKARGRQVRQLIAGLAA